MIPPARTRGSVNPHKGIRFAEAMRKQLTILIPGLLSLCLFGAVMFLYVVPHTREVLISQNEKSLRQLVGTVITLLESYQAQVASGGMELGAAQKRALARIGSLRHGPGEQAYFWINDLSPRMLLHPLAEKSLFGKDLSDYRDLSGKLVFQKIVTLAKQRGEGLISYNRLTRDNPGLEEEKISFIKLYRPWGWVVGTGVYLSDVNAEVASLSQKLFWACLAIFLLVSAATVYLTAKSMTLEASRSRSLEKLKRSEEKYRDLFSSAKDGFLLIKDAQILDANPAAERMLDQSRDELLGKDPLAFTAQWQTPGVDNKTYYDHCYEMVMAMGACTVEWQLLDTDGKTIPVEVSASRIRRENGMFLATFRDISQRKAAEEERDDLQKQLQQAKTMEAIGTLAGGIAHDFNNILTIVQGNAEMAKLRLKKPNCNPARQLDEIIRATQRANDLVKQILSYSRQTEIEKQTVSLDEILHETVMMLRRTGQQKVGIKVDYPEEPCLVRGNATQLQQVIMNIAKNGIQAMKNFDTPGLLRIFPGSPRKTQPAIKEATAKGAASFSRTPARAWTPKRSTGSSIPFTPPNRRAREAAWAFRWSTG